MSRSTYSQGRQQRDSDKARKKRDKEKRREQRREQGPEEFEVIAAEDIVGNLPTTTEALLAMEERARSPRAAATVPCRLFVGSLDLDTTVDELRQVFSKFGTITDTAILTDRNTGRSRGFGFVTFEDRKDGAQAVAQLNGFELNGHRIVVNVATER
jgi:RNA recognition motif-containing protein